MSFVGVLGGLPTAGFPSDRPRTGTSTVLYMPFSKNIFQDFYFYFFCSA